MKHLLVGLAALLALALAGCGDLAGLDDLDGAVFYEKSDVQPDAWDVLPD